MGQQAPAVMSGRPSYRHSRNAWGSMRLHPQVADNTSAQHLCNPALIAGTFSSRYLSNPRGTYVHQQQAVLIPYELMQHRTLSEHR